MSQLRITEIFYSLQGESHTMGWPTVFIRLTGCPLRCYYCDTTYAFKGGNTMAIDTIIQQVAQYDSSYVTVTGGEPLAQKDSLTLLERLCDVGYQVSLETSGALSVASVDSRVIKVLDLKTPGSGEEQRNDYQNLSLLQPQDQIKFVICDHEDYQWAKNKVKEYALSEHHQVLFSPSHQQLANHHLAEWILADQLKVRFQLQMHKYIWGDEPGR